jgi:ribosome recycling factor
MPAREQLGLYWIAMNPTNVVDQSKTKFTQAVEHFQSALKSLRTGRASASMLDGVVVEAYGTAMPLNQVATVTAPEAQLIQVTPFDPNNLQAISAAIRNNQNLGMNPSDDGRVVRVPVPSLTEERRREIVKQVGQKQEDCMIQLRNVRRDAIDVIDKAKKDKELGEDDAKRLTGQVEDLINQVKSQVEVAAKAKETEIMTV